MKKHIYGVLCASLIINYFTAPIAAPVIWSDVKMATSNHLIEIASNLRPESPTVVPAVKDSNKMPKVALDNLAKEIEKMPAMPSQEDLDELQQLAQVNSTHFSDFGKLNAAVPPLRR